MGRRGRVEEKGRGCSRGEKDERKPEEWEEKKRGDEAGLGKGQKEKTRQGGVCQRSSKILQWCV